MGIGNTNALFQPNVVTIDPASQALVDAAGNAAAQGRYVQSSNALMSLLSVPLANDVIYLGPQTYTLTSLLSVAMTKTRIIGIPGITKITGAFGYAVLQLLDVLDVEFYGIIFESTYVNAVEDTGAGCVFSYRNNVSNLTIRRCKFTAPNANTNGLSFYPRISTGDTAAAFDTVTIEDSEFSDCGRMGIIVLNRFSGASRDEFAKRFYVTRSTFKNLGLSGTYGIAISLDGYGRSVSVVDNEFQNCLGIGIENTGYNSSKFHGNQFRDFRGGRIWSPMSFSVGAGVKISKNSIKNNICLEPSNQRTNFIGVDDSEFDNNQWWGIADTAAHFRNADRNKITRDKFVADVVTAVTIGAVGATTTNNKFEDCNFDNSSYVAGASSTVLFDGATTTGNKVIGGNVSRGSSGNYITETNSATWEGYRVAQSGQFFGAYRIISMSDANYTLSEFNAQSEKIRLNGTLTAGRTVFFPRVDRMYLIRNSTGQTLTLSCAGITTTIANGAYRFISWQELSGGWVDWGALA
jgi:hypothetical protein